MLLQETRLPGNQQDDTSFHLSLVMAGAVSAGAYTAGVMDFLIEALDAMEAARDAEDPNMPANHKVSIDAVLGASAGGICSALLPSIVRGPVTGVKGPKYAPDANHSILYKAWVEKIDMKGLLADDDLRDDQPLYSLLNTVGKDSLEGIRDDAINIQKTRASYPKWLRQSLPVYLTTTNLRGTPYNLDFNAIEGRKHNISMHKDYARFVFGETNPGWTGHTFVDFNTNGPGSGFRDLGNAALGTSAFPGALRARKIKTSREFYEQAIWRVPLEKCEGDNCTQDRVIPPSFPKDVSKDFNYWTIDGGVLNNEPFEMGRHLIADSSGRNERDPVLSTRKLLMIDPFPNDYDPDPPENDQATIPYVLMRMISALKQQARFKAEDLSILQSSASRYAIAPRRYELDENGEKALAKLPLACGSLGAFGGFLDISFRHHDYILGRMNAQRFLSGWFAVPVTHRLVTGKWTQQQIDNWQFDLPDPNNPDQMHKVVPIIPLFDGLGDMDTIGLNPDAAVFTPPWPEGFEKRLPEIEEWISNRVHIVGKALIRSSGFGVFFRAILQGALRLFLRQRAVEAIMKALIASLVKAKLVPEPVEEKKTAKESTNWREGGN
jgi:hypothetical protein